MRLWHKDLIPVLPRQQLVAQYRECCSIAKDWDEQGKTNHVLINKVMDYSVCHLLNYTSLIKEEMRHRGYVTRKNAWDRFYNHCEDIREREVQNQLLLLNLDNFIKTGIMIDIICSACTISKKNMIAAALQKMSG